MSEEPPRLDSLSAMYRPSCWSAAIIPRTNVPSEARPRGRDEEEGYDGDDAPATEAMSTLNTSAASDRKVLVLDSIVLIDVWGNGK